MKSYSKIIKRITKENTFYVYSTNPNLADNLSCELVITSLLREKFKDSKALILTDSMSEMIALINSKIKLLKLDFNYDQFIIVKDINDFKEGLTRTVMENSDGSKEEYETELNHDSLESFIVANKFNLIYLPFSEMLEADGLLIELFCHDSQIDCLASIIIDNKFMRNMNIFFYPKKTEIDSFSFVSTQNEFVTIELFKNCILIKLNYDYEDK